MTRDVVKQGLAEIAQVTDFDAEYPKMLEAVRADARLGQQLGVDRHADVLRQRHPAWASLRPAYFDAAIAYLLEQDVGRSRRAEREAASGLALRWTRFGLRPSPSTIQVGFWRPRPYVALDALTLAVGAGRGLRLPRPERRRQDHHAQAADAADLPDVRHAPRSSAGRSATSAMKRRIGYLPENPYFYDYLTAEELLDVLRRACSAIAGAERRSACRALLDEVGIGAERRLQLRKFSKGMLQRVGIAQALINDPEVVFFDEPMSGLDPLGRREIRELILRLRDRGCTVFFSSHVLADAEALCSRVAIVAGGRLVASGALSDMLALPGARLGAGGEPDVTPAALERARKSGRVDAGHAARRRPLRARAAARPCSPTQLLAELAAARRAAGLAQPAARHARGLLRPAGGGGQRPRAGAGTERARTIATSPSTSSGVGPRQGALQPRRVRRAADGGLVSARAAHGRAGRQDHQGPRAGGHRHLRSVHRRVHRHRPGVEGSRAAQHLQPARQADHAVRVHPRQVLRPGADAGRQRRGDDGGLLRGAGLHGDAACRRRCARRGRRRPPIRACCRPSG